ncbi:50S ribosomal protein L11 methyltransferase [Goodfellowiella coeruleoviolacea]|uniref:Protein arginine N-methyltransferase 1 n=1 Tax=Goodfellowiella coeruleoviolacea TaxID=334858 RepID=A0AAE3KGX7_9PSEU|nr:50S ribosomal protein L11 methyltransferase [Goodfellowiella coeruleoviolacea]MCP2167736.1 protein arginine N-methyltransferase 1 [Goodfellowiella coeruleoviolacea]
MDSRLLAMHQVMLGDRVRLDAYDRALARTVRPGDVVVDVGAGTLVLSVLALRHGAGHVYAVEADPEMAALAERIAADNDFRDRITVVQGDARVVRLPRRADVVVAELMGNLGPEEEMVELVGALARRNLAPGGRIVPRRLTTHLTAVQLDGEGWGVWRDDHLGYRLGAVRAAAPPAAQLHFFQREPVLLSAHVPAVVSEVGASRSGRPRGPRSLRIDRAGELHAVMGHFSAELADGVVLSNFPSYPGCNWAVWTWPVRHTPVLPGEDVVAELVPPSRSAAVRDPLGWRLDCALSRRRSA